MVIFSRHRTRKSDDAYGRTGRLNDGLGWYDLRFQQSWGQETWDENHSWRAFDEFLHSKDKETRREFQRLDMGGPFKTYKASYEDYTPWVTPRVLTGGGSIYAAYEGPVFAAYGHFNSEPNATGVPNPWQKPDVSTEMSLNALGTTLISRAAPTNPHASVLTALVELYRDGLPSAIGLNALRRRDAAAFGEEYLNYQFGVLPLRSDIEKIASAYKKADKLLTQYYRDSGRVIRRSVGIPSEVKVLEDVTVTGSAYVPKPVLNSYLYASTSGAKLRKLVTSKTDRWFSGAFTYYAQAPSSVSAVRDQIQKYDYLYGIAPGPSDLWNLLPYSWAADWVGNIGDIMNNLQLFSQDGLVMLRGYVMEHKTITVEYTASGTTYTGSTGPVTATQTFKYEIKERRKATPFGFGLELDGFTDRQWAILAALGLSRGRGSLRY